MATAILIISGLIVYGGIVFMLGYLSGGLNMKKECNKINYYK